MAAVYVYKKITPCTPNTKPEHPRNISACYKSIFTNI